MVYDPIRDCEVPSPSVASATSAEPWRYPNPNSHPPSTPSERDPRDAQHYPPSSSDAHPRANPARQLSFSNPAFSPTPPQHPTPGGSLRGLLNDPSPAAGAHVQHGQEYRPRREVERTVSVTSATSLPEDAEDHRPRLRNILNDSGPGPVPPRHTGSASPRSRASHDGFMQPPPHSGTLQPQGHSTSSRSASTSAASHSPMPQFSPPPQHTGAPHGYHAPPHESPGLHPGYAVAYGEQPPRGQRHMLPPQQPIHPQEHYDFDRRTPGYPVPPDVRSPSMSISPRSQHQPLAYATSRPGSSASTSNPFGYQPRQETLSPVVSSRRMSEEQRPTSASSAASRRHTEPTPQHPPPPKSRQSSTPSGGAAYVPRATPYHSPSPIPQRLAYRPSPSGPSSVHRPIHSDEIAHLRALAASNNPLRQNKKAAYKPPPSWSNTPRRSLPAESDTSYFPVQEDPHRGSMGASGGSMGRPSITPTPGGPVQGYPPAWEDGQAHAQAQRLQKGGSVGAGPSAGNGNGDTGLGRRKRGLEEEQDGPDVARRKVQDARGQYTGVVASVANHYNARPEVGVAHREFSPIIGLKKFNNWVKSVLIGKFAHRPRGRVLDVGCGKGGDLNKWKQARIGLYVGLDLASTSVEQAADRYHRLNKPGFDGFFYAHDCFSRPLGEILPPNLQEPDLYDNVTMQFCMHYAFESASKARMMMENVSRYLRSGGVFIGTIPNAEFLLDRLADVPEDAEELRFGNSCYYVEFAERRHQGVYGHQYSFYLTDAVEDVPEYLVHWENFESLAYEYGLKLVYRRNFADILDEEKGTRDFGPLLGKMGVINDDGESAMDVDQWEAANLYMAFAFEKM
ncbi:hypothetical protein IAT38_000813 [Cryptococcus sp. DSM 104549]